MASLCLDAPGGPGKIFIILLLLAKVRQENKIVLATVTFGIVVTLLSGDRIAYSTFNLPLDLSNKQDPVYNIFKNSGMGELIQTCHLLVWDECTIVRIKVLEAVDRTLRGIRNCNFRMGNVTLSLSRVFRQKLLFVPRGTKMYELNASIKSSGLWHHVKLFQILTNM